jgi:hypothetical protein
MKTLIAILNFFGFRTTHQREVREHRSAGAKKGWAKRKAKPEVPHDVQ